jgi:monoamine oxidase
MTTDVAIVGAGVAGLAAAAILRRRGLSCIVLEATRRIGGRAWTTVGPETAGHWFDRGATWLHDADRNPLAGLARAAGIVPVESDRLRRWRLHVDGRTATAAETAAFAAARADFEAIVRPRAAREPDIAFAEAMAPLRGSPWAATIEQWEAMQIAAADPALFSLHDWLANDLQGTNLVLPGGIGAFVATDLHRLVGPVETGTPVSAIDWSGPIRLDTPRGIVAARAAIVTVSTGILLAAMRFTPGLPARVHAAIARLPMGLLTKIALPAAGAGRLGLPENLALRQQTKPGAPAMSLMAWPCGAPYLQGFIGGPFAWELSRAGPEATADYVRQQVRGLLGDDALRDLGDPLVADWGRDPWQLGSYAYATVGHAGARAVLAEPLADGRLVIAGEAVATAGLAGTLGGAYLSGAAAAETVSAALGRAA